MNVNTEDIAEGSRQYDDKVYKNIHNHVLFRDT